MKFQYLGVIFIIIILPIAMVMSFYIQQQMEVLKVQADYKAKLNDATHDAIKAFQLNTTNSYYSTISDSKIRDIEASVNTFYNSLTASLSYTKSELQAYVPAIVYTLYDGYYIYGRRYNVYEVERKGGEDSQTKDEIVKIDIATDTEENTDPDKYEYGLKPFVYYSCRYQKDGSNDFVVNFTLDNFISVYGTVNELQGNGSRKKKYVTKSGYLISIKDCKINSQGQVYQYKGVEIPESDVTREYLKFNGGASNGISSGEYEYVVYKNQKIYRNGNTHFWYERGSANIVNSADILQEVRNKHTQSAREYYTEAYDFSKWVTDNIGDIRQDQGHIVDSDQLEFNAGDSKIFNMNEQDPEDGTSAFNQHRMAVIKNVIKTNLVAAVNSYNSNAGSYAYAVPELNEEDWEKLVNNVTVVAFLQGIPLGGKMFNDYTVIPNDKNNEFVDTDSVYLLTSDGQYHMANCPLLVEGEYPRKWTRW